jgi:hypothetical protein
MSVDYYADTIIGCEVTGKLFRSVSVSGCAHTNGPTAKFCMECGKPTLCTEEQPIEGYDTDTNIITGKAGVRVQVRHTTNNRRSFAGIVTAKSVDSYQTPATCTGWNINLASQAQAALVLFNLWDLQTFGIWNVMRCS